MAKVLGGPGGLKANNIVPVLGRINRGEMQALEKEIAKNLRAGKTVSVKVELKYNDPGYPNRPSSIVYEVTTDGVKDVTILPNPHV